MLPERNKPPVFCIQKNKIAMKKLYLLLLFLSIPFSKTFSQLEFTAFARSDSNLTYAGFANTKFYYITSDTFLFTNKADVTKFTDSTKSTQPHTINKIDFSKKALLLLPYNGVDCHSRFNFYADTDTTAKTFTVHTDVIDGGCRAGGHYYTAWFLIPKLPDDYKLIFTSKVIGKND